MTMGAVFVSAVLIGLLATLIFTRRPPEQVFLGALTLLVLGGAVPVDDAIAGFASAGLITVALLYVVAAGVQETGALAWLARGLVGRPATVRAALVRLCPPVAVLSAFVNNTPLVAMLIPIIKSGCRATHITPSQVLLAVNYATILGGTCTLIGTSTNLVVAGLVKSHGGPEIGMFTITPVGLPVALAGVTLLILLGPRVLPRRTSVSNEVAGGREYATEVDVLPDGPMVGRSIEQNGLRALAGLYLVEIERRGRVLPAVGPDEVLEGGDRLVFVGALETVVELHHLRGLSPAAGQAQRLDGPRHERVLVEAVVGPRCPLVGRTVKQGRFRSRYDAAIVAISRSGERLRRKIGDVELRPGDTLLLQARPGFVERYARAPDFLLVSPLDGVSAPRHERAPLALAILAGVVALAGSGLTSMLVAGLAGAAAMIVTGCVGFEAARRSLDSGVLLTIGAALGIGLAADRAGIAPALTGAALHALGDGPVAAVAALYLVTVVLTEVLANNAAAALMVPFALSAASASGAPVLPFVLAVMMGASASYATPMGYQTNLMVMGPGGYRTTDFLRLGLPLHVVTAAVSIGVLGMMVSA